MNIILYLLNYIQYQHNLLAFKFYLQIYSSQTVGF